MARLMKSLKTPVQTLVKALNLGILSLGKCQMSTSDSVALNRMFTLKKKGMDYVGQVRVRSENPHARIEVFNESYFEEFDQPEALVRDYLTEKVLSRLLKDKELPEEVKDLIQKHIEYQELLTEKKETVLISSNDRDLDKIFERFNSEYFDNHIQAEIRWGRDVKSRNKSGFRYGSYDEQKRIIRIHPRLKQDFVPISVLELTIYHEMCHQYAPSYKRNGTWQSHHPEFKKKEREYKNFKEARKWEKHNWHRLLLPSEENSESVTA
jgi:hypothetical protein